MKEAHPQLISKASGFTALHVGLLLFVLSPAFAASRAEVALPENGDTQTFTKADPIAPLQIVTSGEKAHYFVKLVSVNNKQTALTIFVRTGETVETTVPLGSYRIKYAAGQNWQGEKLLFGDETQFFEAEKWLILSGRAIRFQGFTLS